jgi:hypothetical protein
LKKIRRKGKMKTINIIIRPVDEKRHEFLAYLKSDFLGATYSLFFKDNIFGSIALNNFSEMIKHQYRINRVEFDFSDNPVIFKNPAVLDVLKQKEGVA